MTGYRSLARNRDFTILWVGETISTLGSRMSLFVFPLVAYALSGSTLTAALIEAVQLLGLSATLLPAGVWADSLHRRTLMLASSATGVLAYGSLTVAGLLGDLTLVHLGIVALVTGAATGIFQPAQMSAIRAVVPTEDLPTALSQNQAREHVAGLIGGPLGGALYAVARWLPFAVDTVSYAVSCFTVTRIRADLSAVQRPGPRPRMRTQLAEGLRFIWGRPFFRVLLSWASLTNLVSNAVFFVVLMRLIQLGYPPVQIGLIETAAGLGGIIGALAAPYLIDRVPTGRLTLTVAWMCVLPLVPLLWWVTPMSAIVAVFALLLINPAGNAGIGAYRVAVTPDDLQGRVSATSQFLAMSVMPLSPLLGGWLLEHFGGTPAVAILIAASAVLAVLISSSRSVRSVPRPRDWPKREVVAEPTIAAASSR